MKMHSVLAASALSLFAFVCSACGAKQEAKAPESDPWSGYQGTYAEAGPGKGEAKAKPEKATKTAEAAPSKQEKAKEDAAAAAPTKKVSKSMIKGESISSIGAGDLAAAAAGNLKTKVVSSDVTVGPQYELVSVQLKGQTIQIVRPAANPDPSGMALPGPKERNGELSKTESGFYDADADVLVIVNSAQKKVSKSSLGLLMKK